MGIKIVLAVVWKTYTWISKHFMKQTLLNYPLKTQFKYNQIVLSFHLKDNTTKSFFAYTNSLKSNIWHIISIYDDEFYLSKLSIVIFWIILFVEAEE